MAVWAHGEREEVDDNTLQTIISLTTDHDDQLVREAALPPLSDWRRAWSARNPHEDNHGATTGRFALAHFVQRSRQQRYCSHRS